MAPILGILASSNYQRVVPDDGAMFPIAMANVGSAGASFVEFTSIPDTYKHLQLRGIVRANRAGSTDSVGITFNGVTTGGAYDYHILYGDGSSPTAGLVKQTRKMCVIYSIRSNTRQFAPLHLNLLAIQ